MTRKIVTGLLIDPAAKCIGPIAVDPEMLPELYMLLGCKAVEFVRLNDDHFLYADEEGLVKDDIQPFFQIAKHTPIAGRAIVFGIDKNGDTVEPTITLQDLWSLVTFPDIEFVRMETETTAEGVSIKPVFKEK